MAEMIAENGTTGEVIPMVTSEVIPMVVEVDDTPNREQLHYFTDGERRIDFVLAYIDDHEANPDKKEKFDLYLKNLEDKFGLATEKADYTKTRTDYGTIAEKEEHKGEVEFIKVHAPIEVLYNDAEDLKMKMPTKENDIEIEEWYQGKAWRFLTNKDPFRLRNPQTKEATNYFVAPFDKERLTEFHNYEHPEKFFTPAERGRLVGYLLQRAQYADSDIDIGIENLIHQGVFVDAYPLHDGPTYKNRSDVSVNERQRLQKDWASFSCLFNYQPIDAIREYFGEKVALYFAWLGFYTAFLIPAAIVGILCFIYGAVSSWNAPLEACADPSGANGTHLFYMCPLCDKRCSYFLLSSNCLYARVTHMFDNQATLFFAIFMSIWATIYLEFWKREDISLSYEWHSIGYQELEEQIRPEYSATAPDLRTNPVTKKSERYVPPMTKFSRLSGIVGVVLFFILLVLVAVVGVAIFRAFISVALLASGNPDVRDRSKMITSAAAGCLNLIAINILKQLYNRVAVILTDWENPRTKTNYEDSFTIKMFLFQFFNTYSSIIYVAFFKTEVITGSPGQYNRFGKSQFRLDGCSAQGCFLELTIQLIIIMVGQQFISNIFETLLPTIMKWWKTRKEKKRATAVGYVAVDQPQWVDDFECEGQTKFSLFWEYLEIVLQYGFVTMFVAGFPLAPFFALVNNVFEIRIDAYNYVHNFRRPLAQRAEDIGAWLGILATLTNVSVLINAFVLAFTSELIPSLVYRYQVSPDGTMKGFINWSLSTFNVADFKPESRPLNANLSGIPVQSFCRYPGFHDPTSPYKRSTTYWMIFSGRLTFVLCFVIFVMLVSSAIGYLIPDMPKSLELKIKREKFLAAKADKEHRIKRKKDQ